MRLLLGVVCVLLGNLWFNVFFKQTGAFESLESKTFESSFRATCVCSLFWVVMLRGFCQVSRLETVLESIAAAAQKNAKAKLRAVELLQQSGPVMSAELDRLRVAKEGAFQAVEDARRALAIAENQLRLAEDGFSAKQTECNNFDSNLAAEKAKAESLQLRYNHIAALHGIAAESKTSLDLEWRQWQDKLGRVSPLKDLQQTELEQLLILTGYCRWIDVFREQRISARRLAKTPESMLRRQVKGTGLDRFGDVRGFVLTLKQLEAGDGLPDRVVLLGGTDDDCDSKPVESWSVNAVAAFVETAAAAADCPDETTTSLLGTAAATICRDQNVTGRVLLSMNAEDMVEHLGLDGDAFFAFEEVVGQLRARDSAAALSPPGKVGVVKSQLSTSVIQALLGEGEPTAFSVEFLRRYDCFV